MLYNILCIKIPSAHCPFAAAFSWTLTANCPVYELKAPACIAAACWLAADIAAAFDAADATCDLEFSYIWIILDVDQGLKRIITNKIGLK